MGKKSAADARFWAFKMLKDIEKEPMRGIDSLQRKLAGSPLDERDRNFVVKIILGVVKSKGTLDCLIRRFSDIPPRHIRKEKSSSTTLQPRL